MTTNILVADDNPKMRKYFDWPSASILIGSFVEKRQTDLEAVSKAAELMPDIVILDLTMPKLNGIAAGSTIHLAAPEMPLLLSHSTE